MGTETRAVREQPKRLEVPGGAILYVLRHKRVKNWNLRVDGTELVKLSVPCGVSQARAEEFLREKSGWIIRHLDRERTPCPELLPQPSRETCARLLMEALLRVYPLTAPLGVALPQLRLRRMKSQWGNCHWAQGYITLNTALCRCPEEFRDYVALHELVHFLHHDHGPGFYERMDALMPDWRERRRALKGYAAALERTDQDGP